MHSTSVQFDISLFAALTCEISGWTQEERFHIYKQPTDQATSLVFPLFLVKFYRDRCIEWKGIHYPMYPVLLQPSTTHLPCVLKRFWHTLSHVRIPTVYMCSCLRNKTLFLKWRHKLTRHILPYPSVVNVEKGKFTNFKNSYKFKK